MASKKVDIILGAVDKTAPAFRSVNSGIKSVIGNQAVMSTAATAAGAAIVAATVAAAVQTAKLVQETAKLGDGYYDLSRKTGQAVEDLAALDYMAKANGGSMEVLALGLKKLSSNLLDAERGSATALATFDDLGVAWDDGSGKMRKPLDVLFDIADAMTVIDNEGRRSALAVDALGKSGDELLPVLMAGAEALRAQLEEYKRLGNQIDGGFAESSDRLLDSQLKVQTAWQQMRVAFAEPFIDESAAATDSLSDSLAGFVETIVSNQDDIREFARDLADISRGLLAIAEFGVKAVSTLKDLKETLHLRVPFAENIFDAVVMVGQLAGAGGSAVAGGAAATAPYPGLGSGASYLSPGQMAALGAQQASARRRAAAGSGGSAGAAAATVGPGFGSSWNGAAAGIGEWGSEADLWLTAQGGMMNPDLSTDWADQLIDSTDTLQADLDEIAAKYEGIGETGSQAFAAIEAAAGQAVADVLLGVTSMEDGITGLFKTILSMGIQAGVGALLPFSQGGTVPGAARGFTVPDGPRGLDSMLIRAMPGEHVFDRELSRRMDRFLAAAESGPPAALRSASGGSTVAMLPSMFPTTRRDAMVIADTYEQAGREIERRRL